jgi:ferrochelatase
MTTGVLLMAHGTPSSLDEMPEYLTRVRGGRPPSPELIAEMRHNYEAIGGRSPLTDITFAQGAALHARLGLHVPVAVGMRNWNPFIKDAVEQLANSGVKRIIAVPLAPQFSAVSTMKYFETAEAAVPAGIALTRTSSFHNHPLLIESFAERVRQAAPSDDEEVIFTAHSVPIRLAKEGDRYVDEVTTTTRLVAAKVGLSNYLSAFQSAGRTPEPWVGPDIADVIRERSARGTGRFLVVPVGFVCDHTEILFDIDVQAQRVAGQLGSRLRRTASLNDSPTFVGLLESLVRDQL